jgi:hypothetical protein
MFLETPREGAWASLMRLDSPRQSLFTFATLDSPRQSTFDVVASLDSPRQSRWTNFSSNFAEIFLPGGVPA